MTNQETKNSHYYGYSKEVHELAEGYLNYEVLKCDSLLVDRLMKMAGDNYSSVISEFSIDKIENFYDTSVEAVEDFLRYNCEDDTWQGLPFDEKDAFANDLGFEPQPQEIYEWWAVTSWLADQLKQFSQPVLSNDFGDWWGRTCTGQAIILDGIMQKIAQANI